MAWKKCKWKEGRMCLRTGINVGKSDCTDCSDYCVEETVRTNRDSIELLDNYKLARKLIMVYRMYAGDEKLIRQWLDSEAE